MNESIRWHYDILELFQKEKYMNILKWEDFNKKKQIKVCIGKDAKGKNEYVELQGWVCSVNKENIFLPLEIRKKDIRELLPVKVIETTTFYSQGEAYERPTKDGLQSFHIPAKKYYTFRNWVDKFYDVKHSKSKQLLLYKLLILGSLLVKINFRVTTEAGFGKNGLIESLSYLVKDVLCYTPDTPAKFKKILENDLVVIDELMDLELSKKKLLEKEFRIAGDGRNKVINSSIGSKAFGTKDEYSTSNLSIGFIYNDLSYYEKNKEEYFDNLYTPATLQRYLPFRFTGELDTRTFDDENFGNKTPDEIYNDNKEFYRKWVMTALYYKDNFYELLKEKQDWVWHNQEVIGSVIGRLNHHFSTFRQVIKLYSKDEEEYNLLVDAALDSYWDYLFMMGVDRPIKTTNLSNETIFDKENKNIGIINGDKLVITCNNSDLNKKFMGFGISEEVLYSLKEKKINQILFNYKGNKKSILFECETIKFFDSELVKDKTKFVCTKDMNKLKVTLLEGGDKSLSKNKDWSKLK